MPYRDREQARGYQREYRRLRRAGDTCTSPVQPVIPIPVRLRTGDDIVRVLETQVQRVESERHAGTLDKARTIGFLLGVALKAIEAGNVAARIEGLEAVLKQRQERESA